MKSKLHAADAVTNEDRQFGSAITYYPARVTGFGGERRALFTRDQIAKAMERAAANHEDFPEPTAWERFTAWARGFLP